VYACLKELEEDKEMIHSPEELGQLEQSIMSYTNQLAALLVKKVQTVLESPDQRAKEKELIRNCPGRMKREGPKSVQIQTRGGITIELFPGIIGDPVTVEKAKDIRVFNC